MRRAWNKGLTKETDSSVRKISESMRSRKIDNFAEWRDWMKKTGRFKSEYAVLTKNGDLAAELIGVVLGDGTITHFPRTECLRVVSNSKNLGFVTRYVSLIENVFGKKPHVGKRRMSNAVNITIYQKKISERLGIPTGAKSRLRNVLPRWVEKDTSYLIRYLRGLYEAEGCHCVHEPTYTHKLIFANTNPALLDVVFLSLERLGFHPHRSPDKIQISRKQEVQKLMNLLEFRRYR